MSWAYHYDQRWSLALSSCFIGLVFSFAIVFAITHPEPKKSSSLTSVFFLGRLPNPRYTFAGRLVDVKMCLYLVGAILLELNVLSFAAAHYLSHQSDPNPGIFVYAALFSFFVSEYLFFEDVHLYTYDFFAENVGFKLGWGCLCFYPHFYCIGIWDTARRPNPHNSTWLYIAAATTFFIGWILARGANMQKFYYKRDLDQQWFTFKTVSSSDGKHKLLCGGFWGLARHVNYLGEILMATGLTLSLGCPGAAIPWLYPLYYVTFLASRQYDDDVRCAKKYGSLWEEYCKIVPYRIVPFIY